MKLDPELIKQAKAELSALVELGEVNFSKEGRVTTGKDVFVGIKLKPSMYRWLKSCANQYTSGNVNGFVRSVLEAIREKEENTRHANQPTRKRLPS